MLNLLPLDIPAVVAARQPKGLLRDSLVVLNNVRPGYYAVIIGPCARKLVYGSSSDAPLVATVVVTNDIQLRGGDYTEHIGTEDFYERLTPKRSGVTVLFSHLTFSEMIKSIPNTKDRFHIRPNGLWYYDDN